MSWASEWVGECASRQPQLHLAGTTVAVPCSSGRQSASTPAARNGCSAGPFQQCASSNTAAQCWLRGVGGSEAGHVQVQGGDGLAWRACDVERRAVVVVLGPGEAQQRRLVLRPSHTPREGSPEPHPALSFAGGCARAWWRSGDAARGCRAAAPTQRCRWPAPAAARRHAPR